MKKLQFFYEQYAWKNFKIWPYATKKKFVFEIFIFFEIFWRKSGILILDLYLQCKYTTQYYKKLLEKYF
jgi:hypothetical protein